MTTGKEKKKTNNDQLNTNDWATLPHNVPVMNSCVPEVGPFTLC